MSVELLSKLIESLDNNSLDNNNNTSKSSQYSFPSPLQFFHLGVVLCELERQSRDEFHIIQQQYQELVRLLPSKYLTEIVFREINSSFSSIFTVAADTVGNNSNHNTNLNDLLVAVESLSGLYCNSELACQLGWSVELCSSLVAAYDQLQIQKSASPQRQQPNVPDIDDDLVLRILSSLIINGLLVLSESETDEEHSLRHIMEVVQILTTDTKSNILGNLLVWQEHQQGVENSALISLADKIQSQFQESTQRDYLLMMLQVSREEIDHQSVEAISSTSETESSTAAAAQAAAAVNVQQQHAAAASNSTKAMNSSSSEVRRRVQQVHNVLPDLGEGYIETILSYFRGDVQRTISALLENGGGGDNNNVLPAALQRMDQKLPARREMTLQEKQVIQDEEAKRIAKQQWAAMERQEESQILAYQTVEATGGGEYDDDYDDQYDELDSGGGDALLGNTDIGLYDYDMIRTYNKMALEIERDNTFWDQNRNVNRQAAVVEKKQKGSDSTNVLDTTSGGDDDDDEGRQYRGPDKGKGGRIIGPDGKFLPRQRGRGNNNNGKVPPTETNGDPTTTTTSASASASGKQAAKSTSNNPDTTTLSANQKRYKNNNKAKMGNHHRKDRAVKKTASAGI